MITKNNLFYNVDNAGQDALSQIDQIICTLNRNHDNFDDWRLMLTMMILVAVMKLNENANWIYLSNFKIKTYSFEKSDEFV